MALKGQPIAIGTSDTTIYTCPASTEASVHGLVFGNNTGSGATITLKVYTQSTANTITIVTAQTVSANGAYTWPKPINVNAGDVIKASASASATIVCLYSVYEGSAPAVAVGFTPRGAWSSGASYVTNDVVSYANGNSYLAIQNSTNQQPDTQTAYWLVLAEKGAPGSGSGDVSGPASSTDNAVARFDGTTGKIVQNSAATIADTTGDITAGKYNGLTVSTTTGTLSIANGKTLAVDNSVTFVGTDSSNVNFGTGGTIAYTGGTLAQFSSTTSSQLAGVISDETGTGSLVFATDPTITLTNATGLPVSTGISGLGSGVATFLATPSSANLASAVTDETGSGALVFGTSPTLSNPTITNYVETYHNIGTVGATLTINLANGTFQNLTLTSATALTVTMPTATAGKSFILIVRQPASGTATTVTFTGVKWPASTAPTITATLSRADILAFFSDGTNWYGSFVQNFTP